MSVPVSLPFTLVNNTIADANQVMADFNALVSGLAQAAAQGANNDITSLNGLITPITPSQGGTNVFISGGPAAGTGTTQVVGATVPNTFTHTNGNTIVWQVTVSNTGPSTLTVGSLPPAQIVRTMNSTGIVPLQGGELVEDQLAWATFYNTNFYLLNPSTETGGVGAGVTIPIVAGTADLGLAAHNHFAVITDPGVISNFGGSFVALGEPLYKVLFGGGQTITPNVNLITPGNQTIHTQLLDWAECLFRGTDWVIVNYYKANGTSVNSLTPLAGATDVFMTNNGGSNLIRLDYACNGGAVLVNPITMVSVQRPGFSGTIDITTGTAPGSPVPNGMAGEPPPANGWGYVYLISNGSTDAGLISLNSSVPTSLPAGYGYFTRIGAVRFTGAGQLMQVSIRGRDARYKVTAGTNTTTYPLIVDQAAGALVWPFNILVHTGAVNFIPPTASLAKFVVSGFANWNLALSASPDTSGNVGATSVNPSEYAGASIENRVQIVELLVTAAGIYVGATNTGNWSYRAYGWCDKCNVS